MYLYDFLFRVIILLATFFSLSFRACDGFSGECVISFSEDFPRVLYWYSVQVREGRGHSVSCELCIGGVVNRFFEGGNGMRVVVLMASFGYARNPWIRIFEND